MYDSEASSQVYEGLRHRVAVDGAGPVASASSEARVPSTEPGSFDLWLLCGCRHLLMRR